jgi:hypothetical protein
MNRAKIENGRIPMFLYVLTLKGDAQFPAYYYVGTTLYPDERLKYFIETGRMPAGSSFTELRQLSADEGMGYAEYKKVQELYSKYGFDAVDCDNSGL